MKKEGTDLLEERVTQACLHVRQKSMIDSELQRLNGQK